MEFKGCRVRTIEIFSVQSAYKIAVSNYNNFAKDQYHVIYILHADLPQAMLET